MDGPVHLDRTEYRIPGPDVFVNFKSDSSVRKMGFKAVYEIVLSEDTNATDQGIVCFLLWTPLIGRFRWNRYI